jgi:hypothetical protein
MKTFKGIVLVIIFLTFSGAAHADGLKFKATLTAAQEVSPTVDSPATAEIEVEFDEGFTEADVELRVKNTLGTVTRAHFHCARPGENGPIIFGLFDPGPFPVGDRVDGTLTNADLNPGQNCVPTIGRVVNNIASLAFAMREGLIYANVHTSLFPSGELRGQLLEEASKDSPRNNRKPSRK